MEAVCEVIKKKSKITNTSPTLKKLKIINLSKLTTTLNAAEFIDYISEKEYIEKVDSVIRKLFRKAPTDIGYSIILSYYISAYPDNVFNEYMSKLDIKLEQAANKVVNCLNKTTKTVDHVDHVDHEVADQNLYDTLFSTIDNYYSLYKIWTSKDSINLIDDKMERIEKCINNKSEMSKTAFRECEHILSKEVEIMFDLSPKFSINKLLENYDIISHSARLVSFFWKCVDEYINSCVEDERDSIVLIMVVHIKIKLINLLTEPTDRKDIYYNVDSEDIVKTISEDKLNPKYINKIIKLLSNKVEKLTNQTIKNPHNHKQWHRKYNKELLTCITMMFNAIDHYSKNI